MPTMDAMYFFLKCSWSLKINTVDLRYRKCSVIYEENLLSIFWSSVQFSLVQSFSHVWLFATPWTAAHQASLSITNSWSPPKPMSIVSVMPSNHLILCCPLLLLPSIFPSIRVFSNESALRIKWPKYWSFSFNISPSNEHPVLISFRMDWLDHQSKHYIMKGKYILNHIKSKIPWWLRR